LVVCSSEVKSNLQIVHVTASLQAEHFTVPFSKISPHSEQLKEISLRISGVDFVIVSIVLCDGFEVLSPILKIIAILIIKTK
jgi:hypothetical protein